MNIADSHTWRLFLQGDKSALEQLIKLHYKSLYNYGTKYSLDLELVRDCIQELFIRIWDHRSRLSTEVNPRAYLIASLRRALHRKIQSESKIFKYHGKACTVDHFDFEPSIEEKIIESESLLSIATRITKVVSTLPKRQKEVIYLKFFQHLSRDEIATIMGNNPQTVSNLLQLALKKLRVSLNEKLFMMLCGVCLLLIYYSSKSCLVVIILTAMV